MDGNKKKVFHIYSTNKWIWNVLKSKFVHVHHNHNNNDDRERETESNSKFVFLFKVCCCFLYWKAKKKNCPPDIEKSNNQNNNQFSMKKLPKYSTLLIWFNQILFFLFAWFIHLFVSMMSYRKWCPINEMKKRKFHIVNVKQQKKK